MTEKHESHDFTLPYKVKIGDLEIDNFVTGINISYDFEKKGDKMKNDNFRTILRSQDVQSHVLSVIEINCQKYETFKKIVDAVMPILEKEDIIIYENDKNSR